MCTHAAALEEFQATAIKEVLAWQIAEAMKANNISRSGLSTRMKTSRSQIGRLLDPKDGNVTLNILQRAAKIVGRSLRLDLPATVARILRESGVTRLSKSGSLRGVSRQTVTAGLKRNAQLLGRKVK